MHAALTTPPVCACVRVRMVDLLAECDLYHGLFQHIRCVEFEGRKYFTRICEYSISQRAELLEPYIESRPLFLEQLVARTTRRTSAWRCVETPYCAPA